MITVESIEDILHADAARRDAKLWQLLTEHGRESLARMVREMKKLRLTQMTEREWREAA